VREKHRFVCALRQGPYSVSRYLSKKGTEELNRSVAKIEEIAASRNPQALATIRIASK
jgi:hypothetical protein